MLLRSALCACSAWAVSAVVPRSEIVNLVRQSPINAGAHNREGWLDLYTPDASVEDPVGTGPQEGREHIGHFYDAFIKDNAVNFTQVFQPDVVANASRCEATDCRAAVGRWVEITTTLSTGAIVKVDAILIYEVVGTPQGLRIHSLRTYWPLAAQFKQVLGEGSKGFRALWATSISLLTNLGLAGTLRYSQGLLGIGQHGEDTMKAVMAALNGGNKAAFLDLLQHATCAVPYGTAIPCADAWSLLTTETYEAKQVHSASSFTAAAIRGSQSGKSAVLRLSFDSQKRVVRLEALADDKEEACTDEQCSQAEAPAAAKAAKGAASGVRAEVV